MGQTVRKTFKYQLNPTPQQEHVLANALWQCRALYNTALEQRKTWWQRGHGKSATYYQQKAELPDLKASSPEYAAVHSQVLQDVLLRLEHTFAAFFQRIKDRHRATPAFKVRTAITPSPIHNTAMGLCWTGACSVCRRLGVFLFGSIAPYKVPPRPSPSRMKPMGGTSASPVPT